MAEKNPFGRSGAGANAFKAAYDRLKSEADLARQNIGQDYASAYQQLRGQTYTQGLGAAAQKGLSGGQAAGVRGAVSAQQMGQLGNLMQGQERALREQKVGEQSIYSNALIEGQQSQEMENARLTQIQGILTNADGSQKAPEDLTQIERQRLEGLGYNIPKPAADAQGRFSSVAAANLRKPPEKEGYTLFLVQLPFGRGAYWTYRKQGTGSFAGGTPQ
jgi:hypothetical protein